MSTANPLPPALSPRPQFSAPSPSSGSPLQGSTSTFSSARTHPLHLKVNKLLSSHLEDAGTRAALDTLGELELVEAGAGAGGGTSGSAGVGDGLRRGGLRKEVDKRMAQGSRDFLDAFSELKEKLNELQGHLDEMDGCCDSVQKQLERANQGTRYLLEHAEGLRAQRAETAVQQNLVHLFLTRFTLSDEELRALSSRDVPVGPALFAAMDKTERIRSDCRALLSGEAGEGTQAGLDIMEYTSQHLEAGYSKIFKWCSFESRGFSKDVLEVSATMREAIHRLKARPDLLSEILTVLGTTRSQSILNLFLDALTRGGPSGLPRPIELHAHDPIRYIGDMLAWIHQTLAGEREFLESLFGVKDDKRWVGQVRTHRRMVSLEANTQFSAEAGLRKLLDKDMEGCGRPLKVRVMQTVRSQVGAVMAYRIATLIHFYRVTMERTIGPEALMSSTLREITDHAYEAFFETLQAQGRSLLRFIQPPAAGLSAPPALREALATLREIMGVHASSLLDDVSPSSPNPQGTPALNRLSPQLGAASLSPNPGAPDRTFAAVLDAALDPALAMCTKMGELRPVPWDRWVFEVNCVGASKAALEGFDFARERRDKLGSREGELVESLTAEHLSHLLREAGLAPLLAALHSDEHAGGTPLSHIPSAAPALLTTALNTFSTFLSTLDPLSSPRLALLPPIQARTIHATALERVSQAYGELWDAVMDERERYEARRTLMRRSKEEVQAVLGQA